MKWTTKAVIGFMIIALGASASAQTQSVRLTATDALEGLSEEARFNRRLGGTVTLIGGGVLAGIGSALSPEREDYFYQSDYEAAQSASTAVVFSGVVVAGIGVAQLLIPSSAERAWSRVEGIEEEERRENRAFSELNRLANSARASRLLGGAVSLGVGLYYLTATPEYPELENSYQYNGILFSAIGAANLLIPSSAERTVDQLNQQQAVSDSASLNWNLAVTRSGGIAVGPQLTF